MKKAGRWRSIGPSSLIRGRRAIRFNFKDGVRTYEAFAVRSQGGAVRAFVNRCPHAGAPLDYGDGDFFSDDPGLLLCRSHGALFTAEEGVCVSGPCAGKRLLPIASRLNARREIEVRLPPSGGIPW